MLQVIFLKISEKILKNHRPNAFLNRICIREEGVYMENATKKIRVNLDRRHSLDVSVNEENRTVVAELITDGGEPGFIYAEKFDVPCNYLRSAIKKGLVYISGANTVNICNEKEETAALNA